MASIEDDQLSLLNPNVFQHRFEVVIKPEVSQNVVLYDDQLYHQVKEFVCDLCNKQYSRKNRLVQHKKTHMNNDEEVKKVNRFQCPFKCGKEPFRTMASLLRGHLQTIVCTLNVIVALLPDPPTPSSLNVTLRQLTKDKQLCFKSQSKVQ